MTKKQQAEDNQDKNLSSCQ